MIKALSILLLPLLSLAAQQYLEGSPEWLVDKFFSSTSFTEKEKYYTGEMINDITQPTIGEELANRDLKILINRIKEKENEQAFAVELKFDEQVIDFYCYLNNTGENWKIEAVRRFLLPGFIYEALDSLSKVNLPSQDDLSLVKTLKLITMGDAKLKNYLIANLNDFINIVWYFNQKENIEVDKRLKELGCSAIFNDNRFPNCVFIQINSFERMEAGFIYATASSEIPSISPSEFVYVEEVLPGWFVYRIM